MVKLIDDASERHTRDPKPVERERGVECAAAAVDYTRREDLGSHWNSRDERLGLSSTWRSRMWSFAVRVHSGLPPLLQKLASRTYRTVRGRR